jgi:hypothetical protein
MPRLTRSPRRGTAPTAASGRTAMPSGRASWR